MIVLVFPNQIESLVIDSTVKLSVAGNKLYAFTDLGNKNSDFGAVHLATYKTEKGAKQMFQFLMESIARGKKLIYL